GLLLVEGQGNSLGRFLRGVVGGLTPFCDAFFYLLFGALVGRFAVFLCRAEVILGDEMIRVIVAVFVAFSVAELSRAFVMRIPQMFGYGESATGADIVECGIDRKNGAVTFRRGGDVKGGFGNGK